ncbi:site-specific integrase [soil metagenome]
MDIKYKIFKRKTGKSTGKWIFRIQYFDVISGKERFMERQTEKKSDAVDECNKQIDNIKKSFGQIQTGERMTFEQLADLCEQQFYKPAVIVEGRKVAGVRSINTVKAQLKVLKSFFGKRLLQEITTESLTNYKLWRLTTKSEKLNQPVKISTVNRELSVMRKMMRFAFGKGWILKDIFYNAKVIETSNEIERTRLLSKDEENRLIENCFGERTITYKRKKRGKEELEEITATVSVDNPHLKAIIILALDSGMRRGEIFKLRWQDFDFENNLIRVIGTHTKTEREKIAPLSQRAKDELEKLKEITTGENPFPFTDIKRSFATAKRLAGIEDLHFHDLRRTAITRWIHQGTSLAFAGKFAGHSQLQTTMKHYTATNNDMINELTEKMNAFHAQNEKALTSKMVN